MNTLRRYLPILTWGPRSQGPWGLRDVSESDRQEGSR